MSDVERSIRDFYDNRGWEGDECTTDAQLWEDLRPVAARYVSACRLKVLDHLPPTGQRLLDAGSGPIQYDEYLEFSRGYEKRVCVDISERALEGARVRLGDAGDYVQASLLDLPFEDGFFDATVTMHTIFHIDQGDQERAVRELLRVTRVGAPVVIVYSNPDRVLGRVKRLLRREPRPGPVTDPLYYYAHPLSWWNRFRDAGSVEIMSWRSLNAPESRALVPDNRVGRLLLSGLLALERRFPHALAPLGAYVIVVLRQR